MSHQPAWDSQTEQGLPTHGAPGAREARRLWSLFVPPEDTGIVGRRGGGVAYSCGQQRRSPSFYEQRGRSANTSKHGEQQAPHRSRKSTWYGGARSGNAYSGNSSSYEGGTGGLSGGGLRASVSPRVEPGTRELGCVDGGSQVRFARALGRPQGALHHIQKP